MRHQKLKCNHLGMKLGVTSKFSVLYRHNCKFHSKFPYLDTWVSPITTNIQSCSE